MNCLYVKPAKAFNKDLKDGTCSAQGYTEATGEARKQSTPVGDIIITFYVQPSELEAKKDCSVYSIGDGKCGESTLNCLYVTAIVMALTASLMSFTFSSSSSMSIP